MRRTLLAGLVLAALPSFAAAQSAPYFATISDVEVIVRSGPSDKYPDTGNLKKGVRVTVDHEEFGWLAIEAPAGSVSWVPIAFVDFNPSAALPQNVAVSEDVTLASGKLGLSQPLTEIRRAKVPAGSGLVVIGQKVTFDNKQWYPVTPIPGDFRYIPKSAVQAAEPASTAFVVRDMIPPGLTPIGATAPSVSPPVGEAAKPPVVNNPLWVQAEAAERDGRTDDAEKLYFQLARQMNEPGGDHDIANLCYTRIHSIREKKRTSSGNLNGTLTPSSAPSTTIPVSTPSRTDRPTLLPPMKNDAPSASTPPAASGDKGAWTGVGRLVSSPLALDGRVTYALETGPSFVQMYVVASPGVKLDQFKNHTVKLFGTTHTHANASKPYIVATDVVEANP